MRDRFGLRRRVDGDALHLRLIDGLRPHGCRQRFRKQHFELVGADAPAPDRHRGAVKRQLGLKIGLSAEKLEIGVFDPLRADLLIRNPAGMFEKMQPDHQPRRQPRTALLGVKGAEGFIEAPPVDQSSQPHQLVAHVDHVVEPVAEHVRFALSGRRNGFGTHRSFLQFAVNHGAWRQEIGKRHRCWKTQVFVAIAVKILQTRIRCSTAMISKSRRLRDFRGRLDTAVGQHA